MRYPELGITARVTEIRDLPHSPLFFRFCFANCLACLSRIPYAASISSPLLGVSRLADEALTTSVPSGVSTEVPDEVAVVRSAARRAAFSILLASSDCVNDVSKDKSRQRFDC